MKVQVPTPTPQQKAAEELDAFFGPEGIMVKKYGGKARWSQAEMALTMNRAIYARKSFLIEAPTGTGKTLAYLIPVALYLRHNPKARFVISVATKHLQAQIESDIGRFGDDFPELKQSAVLKGAGNYLCLNRLKKAALRPQYNKQVEAELKWLLQNFTFLEKLPHGWREELPQKISDATWAAINGDGACCKSMYGCYRRQAKKIAEKANIVVVNTDLLGYNIKFTGNPVPTAKEFEGEKPFLILDEAHTLRGRLTEVESADVSFRTLESALGSLSRDALGRFEHLKPRITKLTQRLDDIRAQVVRGPDGQEVVKAEDKNGIACKELVGVIQQIRDLATLFQKEAPTDEAAQDYAELNSRMGFSAQTLSGYLSNKLPNYVMLLNRTTSATGNTFIALELKPFDMAEAMHNLWDHFQQTVLISATLIGTSITETKKTFNATDWSTTNFPSPFQYKKQLRVFLPPKGVAKCETPDVVEHIKRIADITDGHVMTLFTNYANIAQASLMLGDWCRQQGYGLYVQERNVSSETLVEQFNRNPRAIILGNQSMGTGVDLRLRALIITKIPFDQQTPYREARQQYLKTKGIDPFSDDTLPETARKWKQWWGRLIRDEQQKGLLVLLDPKLNSSNYGQTFLKTIPADAKSTHLNDPSYPLPTREQFLQWRLNEPETATPAPAVPAMVID